MCTVLLPLSVNPIAVNKYINVVLYHISSYQTFWLILDTPELKMPYFLALRRLFIFLSSTFGHPVILKVDTDVSDQRCYFLPQESFPSAMFEVPPKAVIKINVFWDVTLCRLVVTVVSKPPAVSIFGHS